MRTVPRQPRSFDRAVATALAALGLLLAAPAVQIGPATAASAAAQGPTAVQMKHYSNAEWRFALDIPARWNAFPPGPPLQPDEVSSPFEVIRFVSSKPGERSGMVVYRMPRDPSVDPVLTVKRTKAGLAKRGFSNFVMGQTRIGPRAALTLDCERAHPGGETWRVRTYFIADDTLTYVLGFGATRRDAAFGLYDQVAKSFVFDATAS